MQFSSSLKLNHIFRRLYRKGSSAANGYLVLYCRKNGSQANRVGLTVGAKLAHAVQRNRLRSSCVKFTGCTRLRLPVDMILSSSPGCAPSARITRRWSTPIFRLPQGSAC